MAQVCFSSDTFLLFLIINIGIIIWALYSAYQKGLENQSLKGEYLNAEIKAQAEQTEKEEALNRIENIIEQRMNGRGPNGPNGPREIGYNGPPPVSYGLPVYTPTRGEPTDFYVVGYIYRKCNPDQTMKLLERYLYSNRYEYCTMHHNNPTIKVPVYTHNYEQLSDGDKVKVQGYKGHFNVTIYPRDPIRVIPY